MDKELQIKEYREHLEIIANVKQLLEELAVNSKVAEDVFRAGGKEEDYTRRAFGVDTEEVIDCLADLMRMQYQIRSELEFLEGK